jgi:hypothetical protein
MRGAPHLAKQGRCECRPLLPHLAEGKETAGKQRAVSWRQAGVQAPAQQEVDNVLKARAHGSWRAAQRHLLQSKRQQIKREFRMNKSGIRT